MNAFIFALTTGLSALLLFAVQPLISKAILPWFGGGPGVWTTAMLFFQCVLLAGYGYAHLLSSRLSARVQVVVHVAVLLAALTWLPITPDPSHKPAPDSDPVTHILLLLALTVGLPYFALSTTTPLLQRWFGGVFVGRSPHRLYALSNLGSLLALLSYPSLMEPWLNATEQTQGWSWAFALFVLGVLVCAFTWWRSPSAEPDVLAALERPALSPTAPPHSTPRRAQPWLWFLLACVPSWMLLAITHQLCIDVAAVPFLWVAPLVVYLGSFILCFGAHRFYSRQWCSLLWVVGTLALCVHLIDPTAAPLVAQVGVHLLVLAACAMVCHGELAARRPALDQLTAFYFVIALGGAAGGVLVGVIAPSIFVDYFELHLGVIVGYLLLLGVLITERRQSPTRAPMRITALGFGATALGLFVAVSFGHGGDNITGRTIEQARNFYGVLRVADVADGRVLSHGRIWHGFQRTEPSRRREPTLCFTAQSGIGRVLSQPNKPALRVGIVGLGVGTLAAYGRVGDAYRFYEIDPNVVRLAQQHFTFLADSHARIELASGDARLTLEAETPQAFDVLVIDAFSSDAVPVHLLTAEAFAGYRRHLRSDGVLAVHVSNRYLDLVPVVRAAADYLGFVHRVIKTDANYAALITVSTWVLLAADAESLPGDVRTDVRLDRSAEQRRLWTDARSSLFEVLR